MDKIREKLSSLKLEADTAQEKLEEAEARIKQLEEDNLSKEQEINSYVHKTSTLEKENEKLESQLDEQKKLANEGIAHSSAKDALSTRNSELETQLDDATSKNKELSDKLKDLEVKYEEISRSNTALEHERETSEQKLEEMTAKYNKAQAEVEDITSQLSSF